MNMQRCEECGERRMMSTTRAGAALELQRHAGANCTWNGCEALSKLARTCGCCRSCAFGPIKWWPSAAGNGFWRATRHTQIAFAVFMVQLGICSIPGTLNAFYLIWARISKEKKKNHRAYYYCRLFDICVNQCAKLPNCLLSFCNCCGFSGFSVLGQLAANWYLNSMRYFLW